MTTFKPSRVWQITAACTLLCAQAAHAADPDFLFQINATNTETGQAVQGSVFIYPQPVVNTPQLDETLSDGTRHRSFRLDNVVFVSPFYPSTWQLASGSVSISSVFNSDGPFPVFTVNQYLHTDGSSSLTYAIGDVRAPARHETFQSLLTFTLDCACNKLFTDQIDANTFARYDTIKGKGSYSEYFTEDGGTAQQTFEKHIAFAATAVPEPEAMALMLAGMGVVGVMGLNRKRRPQPAHSAD